MPLGGRDLINVMKTGLDRFGSFASECLCRRHSCILNWQFEHVSSRRVAGHVYVYIYIYTYIYIHTSHSMYIPYVIFNMHVCWKIIGTLEKLCRKLAHVERDHKERHVCIPPWQETSCILQTWRMIHSITSTTNFSSQATGLYFMLLVGLLLAAKTLCFGSGISSKHLNPDPHPLVHKMSTAQPWPGPNAPRSRTRVYVSFLTLNVCGPHALQTRIMDRIFNKIRWNSRCVYRVDPYMLYIFTVDVFFHKSWVKQARCTFAVKFVERFITIQ